jgi:hypothetical protein
MVNLFQPILHTEYRIHPLINGDEDLRIMGPYSQGMCLPPPLYYALPIFNYNTNQVEIYVAEKLMANRSEMLGILFSKVKKSEWRRFDYHVTFTKESLDFAKSASVWLEETVETPSLEELREAVKRYVDNQWEE